MESARIHNEHEILPEYKSDKNIRTVPSRKINKKNNKLKKERLSRFNPANDLNTSTKIHAPRRSYTERIAFCGKALAVTDALTLLFAFVLAGITAMSINAYIFMEGYQALISKAALWQMGVFAVIASVGMMWLDSQGHYRSRIPYWTEIKHLVTFFVAGFIVHGFIVFAGKGDFSRLWLGLTWALGGGIILISRHYIRKKLSSLNIWQIPTLLVGSGETAKQLALVLEQEKTMGYEPLTKLPFESLTQLRSQGQWHRFMAKNKAEMVLFAIEGTYMDRYSDVFHALARADIPCAFVPPWQGLPASTMSPQAFFSHDFVLLPQNNRLKMFLPKMIKRSADIVGSGLALLLLFPLFAGLFIAIKRDGGPAFYSQKRVGLNGKTFRFWKFRSMVVNADSALKEVLKNDPEAKAEWEQYQKLKNDPRITKLGRFIRKTSIDELPQLWNVLKGDMSLVGPRPILPEQQYLYGNKFSDYTSIRPGITGPWQVSGRNALTFERRIQLESWYARNWAFWTDIVILLKTVIVLLKPDKAY